MAYPGFQRGGCLRSGPIRKVGGGGGGGAVHFRSDNEKWGGGGGNSLQVRGPIRKVGGPVRFRSDIRKVGGGGGGGAILLQVRYLCLAHTCTMYLPSTYVLPRYTSHARANELKCMPAKVKLL